MKAALLSLVLAFLLCACHPTHFVVGQGPQQQREAVQKNKFLLVGLIPIGTPPAPKPMSQQAEDYQISVKLTFGDLLLNVVTLGIYSPLTVKVVY